MARRKNLPPKGVVPPQLRGKGFDAHPENRNKKGPPKTAITLRNLIAEMGEEEIEVMVRTAKGKEPIKMTRLERILLAWFESDNSRQQELLFGYGFGKPQESINVTGELKTIQVVLKKKSSAPPPTELPTDDEPTA